MSREAMYQAAAKAIHEGHRHRAMPDGGPSFDDLAREHRDYWLRDGKAAVDAALAEATTIESRGGSAWHYPKLFVNEPGTYLVVGPIEEEER